MALNSNVLTGFGGQTTWDTVSKYAMKSEADIMATLPQVSQSQLTQDRSVMDAVLPKLQTAADQIRGVGSDYLSGNIPGDLQKSIFKGISANTQAQGLLGLQRGAAITAQKLGLTGMELQERGAGMLTQASAIDEMAAKMQEARRQFDTSSMQQNVSLLDQMRKTNLAGVAIESERLANNARNNLAIAEIISRMVSQQQTLGAEYALNDLDADGMIDTFDDWIGQFQKLMV